MSATAEAPEIRLRHHLETLELPTLPLGSCRSSTGAASCASRRAAPGPSSSRSASATIVTSSLPFEERTSIWGDEWLMRRIRPVLQAAPVSAPDPPSRSEATSSPGLRGPRRLTAGGRVLRRRSGRPFLRQ